MCTLLYKKRFILRGSAEWAVHVPMKQNSRWSQLLPSRYPALDRWDGPTDPVLCQVDTFPASSLELLHWMRALSVTFSLIFGH